VWRILDICRFETGQGEVEGKAFRVAGGRDEINFFLALGELRAVIGIHAAI
jgi:hypothetical protein